MVYSINTENPSLVLNVSDVLLLTHFVGNSTSLRSHDHNWVPICLPAFNNKAYLQVQYSVILSDVCDNEPNSLCVLVWLYVHP